MPSTSSKITPQSLFELIQNKITESSSLELNDTNDNNQQEITPSFIREKSKNNELLQQLADLLEQLNERKNKRENNNNLSSSTPSSPSNNNKKGFPTSAATSSSQQQQKLPNIIHYDLPLSSSSSNSSILSLESQIASLEQDLQSISSMKSKIKNQTRVTAKSLQESADKQIVDYEEEETTESVLDMLGTVEQLLLARSYKEAAVLFDLCDKKASSIVSNEVKKVTVNSKLDQVRNKIPQDQLRAVQQQFNNVNNAENSNSNMLSKSQSGSHNNLLVRDDSNNNNDDDDDSDLDDLMADLDD